MRIGLYVFLLTYVLISARRLSWLRFDRPAGALLGAVLCVVTGALTPSAALHAVDGATLLLLFGVMGMGAFLAVEGFFDEVEAALVHWARTPRRLLAAIVWSSGVLSAFITNDAVCVLGAPLVVRLIRSHSLRPLPFLLALATAANTGSVATLVGNPQNMLCGLLGGLSYREHLTVMAPVALVGLAINQVLLQLLFRKDLAACSLAVSSSAPPKSPLKPRVLVTLAVIMATAAAYTLGADLSWTAALGFVVLMLIHRRETSELWPRIDWSVLLFFAGLFVVVEAFIRSGAPAWIFERAPLTSATNGTWGWLRLSGIYLVGSNVVSNVPFILVVQDELAALPNPKLAWEILAMASTFAGNLTLLGSVANVIVAEQAHSVGGISFWQYLRIGAPLALLTTLLGTLWLVAVLG